MDVAQQKKNKKQNIKEVSDFNSASLCVIFSIETIFNGLLFSVLFFRSDQTPLPFSLLEVFYTQSVYLSFSLSLPSHTLRINCIQSLQWAMCSEVYKQKSHLQQVKTNASQSESQRVKRKIAVQLCNCLMFMCA